MSRFAQKLADMVGSPLVQRLVLGFIFVALINIGFAFAISLQAVYTEKQAADEYRMIKVAQRMSDIAAKLLRHRSIVDDARFYPDKNKAEHDASCNRIKAQLRNLKNEWHDAELPAGECQKLTEIIEKICSTTPYLFVDGWPKEKRRAVYASFLYYSMELYKESTRTIRGLNEKIKKQTRSDDGSHSLTLCLAAIAFNGVACIVAAYAMSRGITNPLSRLAAACENLISGEVIAAPRSQATEIGELEATFNNMSSTVARAETLRKELLRQMQDVHEVTLEHVKKSTSYLASAFGDTPRRERHFELMTSNIDGMLFLLSSMTYGLSFNFDEELKVAPTKCNTTGLIERTSASVDWLVQKSHQELVIDDPNVEMEVDEHLIQRVLINLISNATKYAPNRSQIKLDVIPLSDGRVRFEVRDTGCGIAPDDVEKLFHKYSQVQPADGVKRSGSGLGLLICKEIVEAHGGEIGCDSVVGEGSCFWFVVPQSVNTAGRQEKGGPSTSGAHQPKLKQSLFLLVTLFAVCQIGIASSLGSQLESARQTFTNYARHKNTILNTQELLTEFLIWREAASATYLSDNWQGFFDLLPLLKQEKEKAQNLMTVVEQGSDVQKSVQRIISAITTLDDVAIGVLDAGKMSKEERDKLFLETDRQGYVVEDSLFWILDKERDALPKSYNLASQLRFQISLMLVAATVFNILVLTLFCRLGLGIFDRVTELNNKATYFMRGGDLVPTLPGNDELTFLDRRLCYVTQKVRLGQTRRQDLMAVINHDLRTPLSALLAGFEMLGSGMLGDCSDETEKLIARTEAEVSGVLSAINEFLEEDKKQAT